MPQKKGPGSVRLELSPEELSALLKSVDMYGAYLTSQQRGDRLYEQLAEKLRDAA